MSDTFWIALGAIGSTAAFFAIAYQSYETRVAVKVSQLIAADAVRGRLDAQVPEVTVRLSPPPWPPLARPTSGGKPVGTWPPGQAWHFPAQEAGSNRIVLQQQLVLENRSERRVQARFEGNLVVFDENNRVAAAGVLLLGPGTQSPEIYLQRDFTIKELSENFTASEAGQELPHQVLGSVTVGDDRDNGSTDRWDLVLTGSPVHPVPDREALWQLALFHIEEGDGLRTMDYSLLPPRQRIHWISRSKGIQLPPPTA
jgi:hypothetical protein